MKLMLLMVVIIVYQHQLEQVIVLMVGILMKTVIFQLLEFGLKIMMLMSMLNGPLIDMMLVII